MILPLHCRRATPYNKRAMIVASSLWITFVYKIRGLKSVTNVDPFYHSVLFASLFLGHQDRFKLYAIFLFAYVIVFSIMKLTQSVSSVYSNKHLN